MADEPDTTNLSDIPLAPPSSHASDAIDANFAQQLLSALPPPSAFGTSCIAAPSLLWAGAFALLYYAFQVLAVPYLSAYEAWYAALAFGLATQALEWTLKYAGIVRT